MGHIKVITTTDGSHSLLNTNLGESYHSHHGAVQESLHVFINNGLIFFQEQNPQKEISILEIGFGTGLNVLLTLKYAPVSTKIRYSSIEAFPLEKEVWSQLNYGYKLTMQSDYEKIHESAWNNSVKLNDQVSLLKLEGKLQDINLTSAAFDIVYFDAFAPNKQPEMWELPILEKVYHSMSKGSILVTYCAKGQLKRDLKSLGFLVSTLPGPPGKKEMVRAAKT